MNGEISTIFTALVSSIVSSSIVGYFIKTYYEKRVGHNFDKLLEEYKAKLGVQSKLSQQIASKRFDDYRKLTEQIYRIRNALRTIIEAENLDIVNCLEYIKQTDNYVEQIYISRLDLERDNIFPQLHLYKNRAAEARRILYDWTFLAIGNKVDQTSIDSRLNDLRNSFQEIESHYLPTIELLKDLTET